ncbi:hypothetical protein C4577_00410 [Candidatus Parcubacteria bacterium]|nr:MAG: hypothetical protein C4577_00410 [Candidatus Parcubacteria bacterium]
MAYQYTNNKGKSYYLHGKEVRLRSGKNQQIYYFAQEIKDGAIDQVPAGFVVIENHRTGMPVLKKG